jgi:hypothetical protein
MALAKANPNPRNSSDLDGDSRRKFLWNYVPAKERQRLEGDNNDTPIMHPVTCRNYWEKYDRQVRTGQIPQLPVEILRHDLMPMWLRQAELMGIDYCFQALSRYHAAQPAA